MSDVFFTEFLMISEGLTLAFLGILGLLYFAISRMAKKKVKFSTRVLVATGIGLVLGLLLQAVAKFPTNPMEITFIQEVTGWYGLFGNGFIDLIRMLVVPLVMVSIVHVIIHMKEDAKLGKMARTTFIITMIMVCISVIVGLVIGVLFGLGTDGTVSSGTVQMKEVSSIVSTLRGLLPANPAKAMVDVNIIALVIMAAFFGLGAKRMSKKYMDTVKPFFDLIDALQKIIVSVAMSIVKLMPYAVVPLLANTIAQRGISSILEVGKFIFALYLCALIMFLIQLVALAIFGYNPIIFIKKSISVMVFAFTSRSSVGTLPFTVSTLTNRLGVNDGTASFVAGFGTTAGMQGCAGFFPALLLIYVCNLNGISMDVTFFIMSIIVVSIGSLGIAGIPGTATMAASVALSGTGLGGYFSSISPILAIDPIIDMGRTLLNVTGSLTNALMVDKMMNLVNMDVYKDMTLVDSSEDMSIE